MAEMYLAINLPLLRLFDSATGIQFLALGLDNKGSLQHNGTVGAPAPAVPLFLPRHHQLQMLGPRQFRMHALAGERSVTCAK
jgi:hypothetical protein